MYCFFEENQVSEDMGRHKDSGRHLHPKTEKRQLDEKATKENYFLVEHSQSDKYKNIAWDCELVNQPVRSENVKQSSNRTVEHLTKSNNDIEKTSNVAVEHVTKGNIGETSSVTVERVTKVDVEESSDMTSEHLANNNISNLPVLLTFCTSVINDNLTRISV